MNTPRALFAAFFCLVFILVAFASNTAEAAGSPALKQKAIGTLSIPSIGVHARVLGMGSEKNGRMAVPKNYVDIGWYNKCAIPGETGTAVLAAHVDNGGSTPGVFKNIALLKAGDMFTLVSAKGNSVNFIVRTVKTYDKDDKNTAAIFGSSDEKAHLNLITCFGAWIPSQKTYAERLVVFTERV